MKRLSHILLVVLVSLGAFLNDVHAQSKVGTTAAPFLTLGTGARASALGHSYTALANGPDALFWNPAGIAIKNDERDPLGGIMFTNKQWFANINYNAIGATLPVTRRGQVLGAHVVYLDYGSMPVRTVDRPEGTGEMFSSYDISAGLSFASPVTPNFYVGGTAKYVRQRIWDMTASTVAIDIGFTLITPYLNGLRMGASLSNFGGKMQMDGINTQFRVDPFPNNSGAVDNVVSRYYLDEWDIPVQFKFGILWPVVKTGNVEWQIMGESHQTNDQHLNADFGSQLLYRTRSTTSALRTGYKDFPLSRDFKFDHVDSHWTFGVGFETYISQLKFGVDYAYVPFQNLGYATMIDIRVYF